MENNFKIQKRVNIKFINNIIYIFFIKISISKAECDISQPFKRGEYCSPNVCEENEDNCLIDNSIIKTQWLNNIFIFNDKNYRYGSIVINDNGDLIIEYSYSKTRIFFGLKKNGDYYFNDKPTKIIDIEDEENFSRSHSRLMFVTNNYNQKQYLFSTGFSNSITELYDMEDFSYIIQNTTKFIGREIFSYKSTLSELKFNDSYKEYLISYLYEIPEEGNNVFRNYVLNKFSFSNFELNPLDTNKDVVIWINLHNRISNSFIMDNKIIAFYLTGTFFFRFQVFDFNLKNITDFIDIDTFIGVWPWWAVVFLKGFHLKDNLLVFNYYSYKTNLKVKLGKLTTSLSFEEILTANINYNETNINLNPEVLLNDCIKINEKRIIFISLSQADSNIFYILLYDFYNNYNNLKIRVYKTIFYQYKIDSEFTINKYNNHLILSSTVVNSDQDSSDDTNRFSLFLIYGYVNGTDNIIEDISNFIFKENSDNLLNIVEILTQNILIENNIFGYEPIIDKIKLTSIPEEILFYNKTNINIPISNGDFLDKDYIFKQNKNKIKNSEYYSFEYQNIVKESDYSNFNKYPITILNFTSENSNINEDEENYFQPQYFYGKINTVKFKLCHKYCNTCYEYGYSNDNQKCMSCKEEYSYNYFNEYPLNCVPLGYFNDKEEQKLVECNNFNSKFYITLDNKKICFKNKYSCPLDYPYYDDKARECLNSISPNNSYIFDNIIKNIIETYPSDGESIVIEGEDNYVFQITTNENELNSLNGKGDNPYNLSIIDLGECEKLIKTKYEIDENTNLIILKLEQLSDTAAQRNVQYEIYNPNNPTEKLDISICQNVSINLYLPITLSEKSQKLYQDLKEYGYDLFDINDPFYQDICTPYSSENNTDILLSDRKNDFYNANETGCQANCEYSDYLLDSGLLKCECNISNEEIDIKNPNKFEGLILITSFYEILKYSNYKVLKCYNLVLTTKVLIDNKGSIVVIIYFLIYFIFLCIYIVKGLKPLRIEISKILFDKIDNIPNNRDVKLLDKNLKNNKNKKEVMSKKNKKNNSLNKCDTLKNILKLDIVKKKTNRDKYKTSKNSIVKNKNVKINFREFSYEKINNSDPPKKLKKKESIKSININFNNFSNIQIINKSPNSERISIKNEPKLDDFQINELEYNKAVKLDKRKFLRMYWSVIKREHTLIFLFYFDDYNLYYIKFARCFFLICTDMALNVFFFSDDSMHKIYLDYGKYNFIQQIPQIIYSTIISQLLQEFICYLSLTDKHIYKIKDQVKSEKKQIFKILKCIRLKLLGFFAFTILLYIFYWYLISTFCAVYKNTQIVFIKNSILSFITGLLYPFVLYLFPTILRKLALSDTKKSLKFLYKLSDVIHFF